MPLAQSSQSNDPTPCYSTPNERTSRGTFGVAGQLRRAWGESSQKLLTFTHLFPHPAQFFMISGLQLLSFLIVIIHTRMIRKRSEPSLGFLEIFCVRPLREWLKSNSKSRSALLVIFKLLKWFLLLYYFTDIRTLSPSFADVLIGRAGVCATSYYCTGSVTRSALSPQSSRQNVAFLGWEGEGDREEWLEVVAQRTCVEWLLDFRAYFPFIIAIIFTYSSCIALFVDVGVEGVPRSIYDSTHIQFSQYELCIRNVYMREALKPPRQKKGRLGFWEW